MPPDLRSVIPAAGAAAPEMLTSPVISTTSTRVPGMRFLHPASRRSSRPAARSRSGPASLTVTCHTSPPQLGKDPGDISGGQISHDLRRLRAHQIIEASRTAATTSSPPTACPPPCSSTPTGQARHPCIRPDRRWRPTARQPAPPGRPRLQHSHSRSRQPRFTRRSDTTPSPSAAHLRHES
jgi:hypothetical protein